MIKAKWYSIRRKTAIAAAALGVLAAAEIQIYGDIGESYWDETVNARDFVREISALEVDQITIRINSMGGSVPDGLAIYNAIKRHKATVTTEIDGMAFSIASLIAMAGDKVQMAANALLMIHAPWTVMAGNSAELREAADMLDTWAAGMSTSYAAKTGKPAGEMLALITDGKDHYYTAEEALAENFIDGITDAVPATAMASAVRGLSLDSRYRDVPAAWLQACGVKPAAAPAAAPSVASATQTQEPEMKFARTLLATAVLMNAAGADGSITSGTGTGAPVAAGGMPATPSDAQRQEILAADNTRRSAIAAHAQPFMAMAGVTELVTSLQANHQVTADAAGLQILAHVARGASPVAGGNVQTVADESDKFRAALTDSIMARAGVKARRADGTFDVVRADSSNPYRGRKLLQIAEACLARAGVRTEGMDQRALVNAAFTQTRSDFPILLENVLHKTLQAAYAIQADTWSRFCSTGSVSDFRAHPRYRVGSLSNLESLNELGQYRQKFIPDGEKSTITAATKGNIIGISRETIINDDMGAFTGLAQAMGRAAKRTVEADVYALLALNAGLGPVLADGLTLFHATHANIGSGAPTVTSFEANRVLLRAQKDVGANDYLELSPAIWLGPDALYGQAKTVVKSTFDPDANNKLQRTNIAQDLVRDLVSTPRLTGAPWYFFAEPTEAPVVEVAFLDGISEPYLEMQNGFDTDGVQWKVRMDYGVAGIDYRGAVRSTGV